MKIISLQTENIKCLKAVEISPGGESVEIAGKNGHGKSSVLDSIWYALGGRQTVCERPIRDGQSSAKVVLELDDYTVTRTFTASGGGTLKVEARNPLPGTVAKLSSPQAVLDSIVGTLTFDPLEFTRMESRADVLRKLVGLDTTTIDFEHARVYDERTIVNRDLSNFNSKIGNQLVNHELPTLEIDAKNIIAARAEAEKINSSNRGKREEYQRLCVYKEERKKEIDMLEKQLKELREKQDSATHAYLRLSKETDDLGAEKLPPNMDLSGFDEQLLSAQSKNAAIRANNELRGQYASRDSLFRQSGDLTKRLDALALQKDKLITDAKYPVPGLGFSSTGSVTFNGVPFEQLSTAQRLKISAAIGIALNPKLRVMLIRDGSAMDEDTLAELITIAKTNDTQLWIERVGKLSGELPGVVIEDGSVVESTLPQIPETADSKNTDCV